MKHKWVLGILLILGFVQFLRLQTLELLTGKHLDSTATETPKPHNSDENLHAKSVNGKHLRGKTLLHYDHVHVSLKHTNF